MTTKSVETRPNIRLQNDFSVIDPHNLQKKMEGLFIKLIYKAGKSSTSNDKKNSFEETIKI